MCEAYSDFGVFVIESVHFTTCVFKNRRNSSGFVKSDSVLSSLEKSFPHKTTRSNSTGFINGEINHRILELHVNVFS